MHKYIIFTTFFLTILTVRAEDGIQKPKKDSSECFLLKEIAPNASASDYEKLASRLRANNLSTCECVTHIIKKKQKKSLRRFYSKQLLSSEQYQNAKFLQKHLSTSELDASVPLILHLPPNTSLDSKQTGEIARIFPTHIVTIRNDNFDKELAAAARKLISMEFLKTFNFNKNTISLAEYELYVGNELFERSKNSRKAILLHEKKHLTSNHPALGNIILEFTEKNKPGILSKQFFGILKTSHPWLKFRRAKEAEADRIPAACGSCDDAYAFTDLFKEFLKQDGNQEKYAHPSHYKRLLWAQRIYNVKVAEENLTNNSTNKIFIDIVF